MLIDLSHTSHTRARTGVQRVARSLYRALGDAAVPITHDPHQCTWRSLEPWEGANLADEGAAGKRGARWPLAARLRGRLRHALGHRATLTPELAPLAGRGDGLIVPEIFSATVGRALPGLFAATAGPHAAVFHDAIALQFPELTPPKTVARFPAYLVELLAFDGIAAVSDDSRDALLDYWRWLDARNPPPVVTIGLGMDLPRVSPLHEIPVPDASGSPPIILSVGSIEGRKNHLALLEACERVWASGQRFSLHLIGLAQPETASGALRRMGELQAAGRPISYAGPVNEAALEAAYATCCFTVYPSLVEGFGLPVLESLAHGRPCVCSGRRALGEAARGGGCLALESVDAAALAAAITSLLDAPAELATLAQQARARHFRSWADYASELRSWMSELPTR